MAGNGTPCRYQICSSEDGRDEASREQAGPEARRDIERYLAPLAALGWRREKGRTSAPMVQTIRCKRRRAGHSPTRPIAAGTLHPAGYSLRSSSTTSACSCTRPPCCPQPWAASAPALWDQNPVSPAPTSNPNTAARHPRQPLTPPGRAQPRQRALQPVALRPPIPIDQGVSKRIVAVACHQRTGATWAAPSASLRQLFCARE